MGWYSYAEGVPKRWGGIVMLRGEGSLKGRVVYLTRTPYLLGFQNCQIETVMLGGGGGGGGGWGSPYIAQLS